MSSSFDISNKHLGNIFGVQHSILIIDLSPIKDCCGDGSVVALNTPTSVPTASPFSTLIQKLLSISGNSNKYWYTQSKSESIKRIVDGSIVMFTDILVLDYLRPLERQTFRFLGDIQMLSPSITSEYISFTHPSITICTLSKIDDEPVIFPKNVFVISTSDKSDEEITNIYETNINEMLNLRNSSVKNAIREQEISDKTLKFNNPVNDPAWIAKIVGDTFKYPNCIFGCEKEEHKFPALTQDCLKKAAIMVDSWDMYAPSLSRQELFAVIIVIFENFNLFEYFSVDLKIFERFLLLMESNYKPNPYHNFYHAVDVLQASYYTIRSSLMLRKLLKPIDMMSIFVSAIAHDVSHPGFNNNILIEKESLIAWLYNDKSPLENMHSAILFSILRNPSLNFLNNLTWPQWKEFRHVTTNSILATDMNSHFEYVNQFGGKNGLFSRAISSLKGGEGTPNSLSLDDRKLLSVAILKFGDISNVVRPFPVARKWNFHLITEFFHQGDWEKILGLSSSPLTTRSLNDLSKGQQFFLHNLAGPLYQVMAEYFSELHFGYEHLQTNLEKWRNWKPEDDGLLNDYPQLITPPTPPKATRHYSQ